jgi:uncharacterized protein
MFGISMPQPRTDDPDTSEFWDACRQHRLVIQQCTRCDSFRYAPVPMCYSCQSLEYRWVQSRGIGEIYTWTVTHKVMHPAARASVPYNTIVVRLQDCGGALITSNLLGADNDSIYPGMPVIVSWDDVSENCSLPRFRSLTDADDGGLTLASGLAFPDGG